MPELVFEVDRFREWAVRIPVPKRSGEWECEYAHWNELHKAVLEFTSTHEFDTWSVNEIEAVLYAIARDNEIEYLSREIAHHWPETFLRLAEAATRSIEVDAKWQFAEQLGRLTSAPLRRDELLLTLAHDGDEYVRRRTLGALARVGSPATEQLAIDAWETPNESQQWSRMMALWALHRIGSKHFPRLLADAQSHGGYLADYAAKVVAGEIDF